MTQEDMMVAMATNVASLTSRTSMSVIIVGGVVRCFQNCLYSWDLWCTYKIWQNTFLSHIERTHHVVKTCTVLEHERINLTQLLSVSFLRCGEQLAGGWSPCQPHCTACCTCTRDLHGPQRPRSALWSASLWTTQQRSCSSSSVLQVVTAATRCNSKSWYDTTDFFWLGKR